jgi:hypothetical protein
MSYQPLKLPTVLAQEWARKAWALDLLMRRFHAEGPFLCAEDDEAGRVLSVHGRRVVYVDDGSIFTEDPPFSQKWPPR